MPWGGELLNNARTMNSGHSIQIHGKHTLKIWMIDPRIVVQKLIIHSGDLPVSYFGPPEMKVNPVVN
jgi:hypothetical protein